MEQANTPTDKRYHVGWNGAIQKWVCTDYVGATYGTGDTPYHAYLDCCIWLEMMTSDIHQ